MPTPSTVHPAYHIVGPGAEASSTNPRAMTAVLVASTPRPPLRSIQRPMRGAQRPEMSSDQEKAPTTATRETPSPPAAGPAITAGK